MRKRDKSIDLLRTIGLMGVILAHVNAAPVIMKLRGFDVVLLVFVTGLSYIASGGNQKNYISYLKKRFLRLCLPAWSFLCIYFILFRFLSFFNKTLPQYTWKDYFGSFSFLSGIGYVWIIGVYLLIAVMLPILEKILDKIGIKIFLALLLFLYIAYELIIRIALFMTVLQDTQGGGIFVFASSCLYWICFCLWDCRRNKEDEAQASHFTYFYISCSF